jgi:hypothetical protein
VRAMDLHPRLPYIALARQDDAIEIRDLSGYVYSYIPSVAIYSLYMLIQL